jgi:hypothetical protein
MGVTMPTTDVEPAGRDMTHVWAGRTRKARERRAEKAIAELIAQGLTVIIIRPDGVSTTIHP